MSDMAVTSEAVEIPPTPILSSDTTTDASPRTDVNEIPAASDNAADPDGVVAATPSTVPSTLKSSGARHKGGRKDKKKGPRATASTDDADVERKLTHLVIDSGAIIKGAGMTLASAAEVCHDYVLQKWREGISGSCSVAPPYSFEPLKNLSSSLLVLSCFSLPNHTGIRGTSTKRYSISHVSPSRV